MTPSSLFPLGVRQATRRRIDGLHLLLAGGLSWLFMLVSSHSLSKVALFSEYDAGDRCWIVSPDDRVLFNPSGSMAQGNGKFLPHEGASF